MKIPVFFSRSHLERLYTLAEQYVEMFNSLHGKVVVPWRIDTCMCFTLGRLQLK